MIGAWATVVDGEQAAAPLTSDALVAVVVVLLVELVWMGLALGAVFRKAEGRPGRAWIPVLRYVEMARVTQSNVAATATARGLAAAGALVAAVGASVTGGSDIAIAGLLVGAAAGVAAWGMWIVHTHRLGLDHGLPAGLPVLAALSPALWAGVVGWSDMLAARAPGPVAVPRAAPPAAEPGPTPPPEEEPMTTPHSSEPERPVEPEAAEAVPVPFAEPEPSEAPAPLPSPYADLAAWDAEPAAGERVSPYASLAPRAPEPVAETPDRDEAPVAREPETVAEPEPTEQPEATAESEEAAEAPPTAELPVPAEVVASEPPAEEARPPYVEPTPTLPVSPYMRGGAAAPPPAPSAVPTFEIPAVPAPPAPAPAATPEPEPRTEDLPLTAPVVEPAPVAATPAVPPPPPPPTASSTSDEDDRTRMSARQREAWQLVTSEGGVYTFDSATVLVGRAGGLPPVDGTPRLDVADPTRTISKVHARLSLAGGRWSVEDLGSTNGTYLVDGSGREVQVPEGEATPVEGRLVLGDVEIEIRRREAGG